MNPLHEMLRLIYANRLKRHDPIAAFRALVATTIFAYLNLLVVTMLTDPFTGYFDWLTKHGVPTLLAIVLGMFAIGAVQYSLWVQHGKLARERARIESGTPPRRGLVYAYVVASLMALTASGILMHHLKT